MDAVILCGGFGRRMWPLTRERPKALLEVRGRPLIEHILDRLGGVEEIERVFISVNRKFDGQFRAWLSGYNSKKPLKLVVEPSMEEGEKLGSIGAWGFLIRQEGLERPLLSVSGDNFFDFDLKPFLDFYRKVGETAIGVFDVKEREEARKMGIVKMDSDGRIVGFEEKPEKPKGTLASTGIYVFPGEVLGMILKYLKQGENPDKAGFFLEWLHKTRPVFGFIFGGEWVDIGSTEAYKNLNSQG